jgi:DNA replication protein DnaC
VNAQRDDSAGAPVLVQWYEVIADPTLADAILDRVIHNATRIELSGESLRKTRAKEAPSNIVQA